MNDNADNDPRVYAIPDIHGHAKGEHKAFTDERPIPLSARMLFLWFYHACRRGWPRFLMVTDHMNYLTFEDPAAISLVRRALKLAQAGDLYGAAETASVDVGQASTVCDGLRRGMRYSIGAEVDNDPRSRPDAQNIVDAMKPDGMIRSVHFLTIDHPVHGPNWNWPFDNPEFSDVYEIVGTAKTWELYMATLLDAVERLPGNIVGHFYVPALFGHWPDDATLDVYENQIVDACEARGMALEMNTRFLYRHHPNEEKQKYIAVHRRLLAKCKAKNVGIAVGSDAHSPKDQGRGFEIVLALLDECGINELVFPIGGRLLRVALRAERKDEAPPAREAAPAPPADDRKTPRRPRTSETPARPKDTSLKHDESTGNEDAVTPDETLPAKTKPRPKRSKNRAAAASDDGVYAAQNDSTTAADVAAGDASHTTVGTAASDSGELEVALRVGAEPVDAQRVGGDPGVPKRTVDESIIAFAIIDNPIIDHPILDRPIIDQPIDPDPIVDGPPDPQSIVDEPIDPELMVDEPVELDQDDEPTAFVLIAEPVEAESLPDEQSDADPIRAKPIEAELIEVEPIEVEPIEAELIEVEPIEAELIEVEPIEAELIEVELIEVELIEAELIEVEPIEAEPIDVEPIVDEVVELRLISDEPVDPEFTLVKVDPEMTVDEIEPELVVVELKRRLLVDRVDEELIVAKADQAALSDEAIGGQATGETLDVESADSDAIDARTGEREAVGSAPSGADRIVFEIVEEIVADAALDFLAHRLDSEPAEGRAADAHGTGESVRAANAAGGAPTTKPASLKATSGPTTSKKKAATATPKRAPKKSAKPATKAAAKKITAKKTSAKKSEAKNGLAKKSTAKKAPAKKAAVRGTTTKKSAAKKATVKKTSAKKPAQKRR